MGVVYAMYDALVSINVPTEKAKAVIDAMEREMMDKVATKSDVENLRRATKSDLDHVREILSRDIGAVSENLAGTEMRLTTVMDAKLAELKHSLTLQLGRMMATMIGIAVALIGVIQYFH